MFESPTALFKAVFPMVLDLAFELNAFFLLNVFRVPKESNINKYRLMFFFILALPAIAEYYLWMTSPVPIRLGQFGVIACALACLELLVWLKFGWARLLTVPIPAWVGVPWLAMLVAQALWMLFFFGLRKRLPQRRLIILTLQVDRRLRAVTEGAGDLRERRQPQPTDGIVLHADRVGLGVSKNA